MAFVDDLALLLFLMSLVDVIALYTTGNLYLNYRKGKLDDVEGIMRPGAFAMAPMAVVMLILGLFGEIIWPLPGSYNILFYDPFVMVSIIMLILSIEVILKQKLQTVGIIGLFAGLIAIYYAAYAYIDNMTSSPIAMLGLYIGFGATGIFMFPATLIYDSVGEKKKMSKIWTVFLVLFWISLVGSGILAAFTASAAVPQHLLNPP